MTYQSTNSKPNILLGYIRKSVIEDDTTASPARQRAAIERWVQAHGNGYQLEWYQDLDLSGRHEANRPDWQRLLADLDQPGMAGVIVESIDRSHRNVKEFLNFHDEQLEPRGLALISATQDLNLATADGRAMASVVMAFAEMESRKASERMTATIKHLKTNGRHWGPIPFGCDRDPQTKILIPSSTAYYLDPTTGDALPAGGLLPDGWEIRTYHDALRAIYETYATGHHGYRDTTWLANQAGWRYWERDRTTPKELTFGIVHSVLHRWPIFAGELPHVDPTGRVDHSKPTLAGNHDPILPVDLCRQVGRVLAARSTNRNPNNHRRPARIYLLSGILYCGHCGGVLCGQKFKQKRGGDYVYYRHLQVKPPDCHETMTPAESLEQDILNLMIELAINTDVLEAIKNALQQALAATQNPASEDSDAQEIERHRAELERLIDLHVSDLITKEQFISRRATIQAKLDGLQQKTAATTMAADIVQHVEHVLTYLYRLPQAGLHLQKELIQSCITRLEIRDNEITKLEPTPWAAPLFDVCGLYNRANFISMPTNLIDLQSLLVGSSQQVVVPEQVY